MGALLDPILVSNLDIVIDSEVINVDRQISDHDATNIDIKFPFPLKTVYTRKIWSYKNADFAKLNRDISDFDWEPFF